MQPKVWGPPIWRAVHYIALGYPDNPDAEHRLHYKEFFSNLWRVIPCSKCAMNYKRHLTELPPIDHFLECSRNLFQYTVALHNMVNTELGKPTMEVEQAYNLYTNPTPQHPKGRGTPVALIVLFILTFALLCMTVVKCKLQRFK